ncbi:stretch-activated ca2+-permeable channel component domain-containing protein [Hirsutella rhossiliensis]|uniref:Stretch-activated ca2+-permeable channel component domain-containing protein n=1 Tax=Hirsutella rhossiliensis TaxID=111463 RepID=A0A9P8N100_9HYPO|nr:stretch-activated ca2+-permeable channel component domain-containing protein [Hirsutella rhossiliensis]KAH0964922.1 stretch-activated ca2+-permeable channel component domain-containing protein [Hirsutella rhossiliensis]
MLPNPPQYRLAASLLLLVPSSLLLPPSVALAAESPFDSFGSQAAAHEFSNLLTEASYKSEFDLFGHDVFRRAPPGVAPLENNKVTALNLQPGSTACYVLERSAIFGNEANSPSQPSDASPKLVHISANTCLQPANNGSDGNGSSAPQLILSVSNSSQTACQTPTQNPSENGGKIFREGAVMFGSNATGDVFIGITAPNVSSSFQGVYNFELAVSLDDYMHRFENRQGAQLLWMDSDSTSALLVTRNLTENKEDIRRVMGEGLPYDLYVSNKEAPAIYGLTHSVCGLQNMAQIKVGRMKNSVQNGPVATGMTLRGPGSFPKQQFHFVDLNASSSYVGILVKKSNMTGLGKRQEEGNPATGSTVFQATEFQTVSGTNCKIVTDLEFCNEIQYAVPGNEQKFNNTALAKTYDDYAKAMYANFEKAMMQIPCEAPKTAQYSLSRNCDDCKVAYKRWLCTVSMPRCEDFGSSNELALERNARQAFPNGTQLPDDFIDDQIQPGPYKEVLPCDDLCYEVVQSCPAKLGFKCPQPDLVSFGFSYAQRGQNGSTVSCNYPGEARTPMSAARTLLPDLIVVGCFSLAAALMLG